MSETKAVDFSPKPLNIVYWRGDDATIPLRFGSPGPPDENGNPTFGEPYDLTGVEFAAQVRAKEDSSDILATLVITVGDQTDDAEKGMVWIALTSEDAATLPSSARWDLQTTWPGDVTRTYLYGRVTVGKDTTRVAAP